MSWEGEVHGYVIREFSPIVRRLAGIKPSVNDIYDVCAAGVRPFAIKRKLSGGLGWEGVELETGNRHEFKTPFLMRRGTRLGRVIEWPPEQETL